MDLPEDKIYRPHRPQLDETDTVPEGDGSLSRRSILLATAGAALGSAAAGTARAQHNVHGEHGAHGEGSLSSRIYETPSGETVADIAKNPIDLPPPLERSEPATVDVDLEVIEVEAHLAPGATYRYWTFNGTVPGPFVRVRVGDTVNVHIRNRDDSWFLHNVDFHAVNGPGGGAEATNVFPGEENGFRFKALQPGLYVYHCAVPPVAMHISNGMYGLILVEPEEGLPPVDREFYVMQGELYTAEAFGAQGLLTEDYQKLIDERPEYFVLNGHVGALTEHYPMQAQVGETVRIYFGVGGPNFTSSFHVIGEIFDRVYVNGTVNSPPQTDVQTVLVPAGGAAVFECSLQVPGRYVLVDHSLSRAERGLAGYLDVEGEEDTEIFDEHPAA